MSVLYRFKDEGQGGHLPLAESIDMLQTCHHSADGGRARVPGSLPTEGGASEVCLNPVFDGNLRRIFAAGAFLPCSVFTLKCHILNQLTIQPFHHGSGN